MAEITNNENPVNQLSRRDFFRLLVLGATGVAGDIALSACSKIEAVDNNTKFYEILEGEKLPFFINGKLEKISINYSGTNQDKLQMRVLNNQAKLLNFKNGESTVRIAGEIVENQIVELKKNPILAEDVNVGMYPSASTIKTMENRLDFPDEGRVFGFKVITSLADYMKDGLQPFEKNAKPDAAPRMNLENFGLGWAVGRVREVDGEKIFGFLGYVLDSRALVPVPAVT